MCSCSTAHRTRPTTVFLYYSSLFIYMYSLFHVRIFHLPTRSFLCEVSARTRLQDIISRKTAVFLVTATGTTALIILRVIVFGNINF
jgi:hypothetical protein